MSGSTALEQENRFLRARLGTLEAGLRSMARDRTPAEIERMRLAQERCDAVLSMRGEGAPDAHPGETELAYRRRLAVKVQGYSTSFRGSRLDSAASEMLDVIEPKLYKEAVDQVRNDAAGPGKLVEVKIPDGSGRVITKFVGDPMAWMTHFTGAGASCTLNMTPVRNN